MTALLVTPSTPLTYCIPHSAGRPGQAPDKCGRARSAVPPAIAPLRGTNAARWGTGPGLAAEQKWNAAMPPVSSPAAKTAAAGGGAAPRGACRPPRREGSSDKKSAGEAEKKRRRPGPLRGEQEGEDGEDAHDAPDGHGARGRAGPPIERGRQRL